MWLVATLHHLINYHYHASPIVGSFNKVAEAPTFVASDHRWFHALLSDNGRSDLIYVFFEEKIGDIIF